MEMVGALVHRGINCTVVDRAPWPMADVLDPDIVEPIRQSWEDLGVDMQWGNRVTAFKGDGTVTGAETERGDIEADVVIIGTHKVPNNPLAAAAGLELGSTGGLIVDSRMQTSDPNIYAAGDCTEIPHGATNIPIQGLTGSHAYSQGKTAGTNAAGGTRHYRPVFVPWGLLAGEWMIGGVSFGETLATALGIQHVVGKAQGITRARLLPGRQAHHRESCWRTPTRCGSSELRWWAARASRRGPTSWLMAVRVGLTVEELATMENVYSPAIGALNEPISVAAQNLLAGL